MSDLESVISAEGIRTAILAVPAGTAQTVTSDLVRAGVSGILNFAPAPSLASRRSPRDAVLAGARELVVDHRGELGRPGGRAGRAGVGA